MGTFISGIGLISGLPTADLIDQLIRLEGRSVVLLEGRKAGFQAQRFTLLGLSARIVSLQLSVGDLGKDSLFDTRSVVSSNPAAVSATVSAGASLGSFQFQPLSLIQSHQLLSSGFSASDVPVFNDGTLSISGGGFVDSPTSLDVLNGAAGVERGTIRITDRSGVIADIDLTGALDLNDVLDAINQNSAVRVTATVSGDHLVITDNTGSVATNLVVEDVGVGTMAADLGIAANVAANTITGSDVVQLGNILPLGLLNDGLGVRSKEFVDDLSIELQDGTTIAVNLDGALNIGDVIDLINNDSENTGDLTASISADGVSLTLTDTSSGGGTLTVTALNSSDAAEDLGILGTEQGGGVLQGTRIIAGLNTVLLKSLNGGTGISDLGSITITDRLGTLDTIDLSSAETLQDVVDAINSATPQVTATINAARNGLLLTDTSGGTGNLTIADVGPGTAAADLGIVLDQAVSTLDGGDRNRQYIGENTLLESYGGAKGVGLGQFKITDSAGFSATVDLEIIQAKTLGDVLLAINSTGVGVTASINSTGDGILLTDTASGSGDLTVAEVGSGTTAADLRILGSDSGGVLDGSLQVDITIDSTDTLLGLVKKINDAEAGVTAAIINDGSGVNPFKLTLVSKQSGSTGELLIDTIAAGFTVSTTVNPEDAVLRFGSGTNGTEAILLRSSENAFEDVLPGLTLNLLSTSQQTITVSVSKNTQVIVDAVQAFIDDFNNVLERIDEVTEFNTETEEAAILQGDQTVLQIQRRLNDLALSNLKGLDGSSVTTMVQLGVKFDSQGKLTFDETKLVDLLASEPTAVRDFFLTTDDGFSDRFNELIEHFTDSLNGLLTVRTNALDRDVEELDTRILSMQDRLDSRRLRLISQFAFMEQTLALLQTQIDALNRFRPVPPLSFQGKK